MNGLLLQVFHKQVGCTVCLLEVVVLKLEVRGSKAQFYESYQLADGDASSLPQGLILVQPFFHYSQGFIDGDLGEKAGHIFYVLILHSYSLKHPGRFHMKHLN